MKKVLVIAPYRFLPFFSGGQKFIAKLLEHLGKEVDLSVISVVHNDHTLATGYRLIPLLKKPSSRYFDLSLIGKISAEIKNGKYDTIIWEHPYYAWLAFKIRKRTGIKTIIHTHNIEYQRFRSLGKWWWPILKIYEKWGFKKADRLFFITPEDRSFATTKWKVDPAKCFDVPFGIDISSYPTDRDKYKDVVRQRHGIAANERILLFSGLLNYKPNLQALKTILENINPLLLTDTLFRYKIIICGKELPAEFNELNHYKNANIIYAGFVENIEEYYLAADIFLNPVQTGGGVKTKMIEAIAYGATVVATETGATGIARNVCGDKLVIVADHNWEEFAKAIIKNAAGYTLTPKEYYNYYFYGNIVNSLIEVI